MKVFICDYSRTQLRLEGGGEEGTKKVTDEFFLCLKKLAECKNHTLPVAIDCVF